MKGCCDCLLKIQRFGGIMYAKSIYKIIAIKSTRFVYTNLGYTRKGICSIIMSQPIWRWIICLKSRPMKKLANT